MTVLDAPAEAGIIPGLEGYPEFRFDPVQLAFIGQAPPGFGDLSQLARVFEDFGNAEGFYRGDLLMYMIIWHGEERALQLFDPLHWRVKSWQNSLSVVRRMPPDDWREADGGLWVPAPGLHTRRRQGPTYSHHAEVAYLDPAAQSKFLQLAIDNGWSVRQLREQVQAAKPAKDGEGGQQVEFQTNPMSVRASKLAEKVERLSKDCTVTAAVVLLEEAAERLRRASVLIAKDGGDDESE